MKPTLLVLAAGLGSRYGGLKQLDGLGPNSETIMDYSIYDAVKAGFGKVVFVIRETFEEEFREKVAKKYEHLIPIEIVFQELDSLPEGFELNPDRVKPWGTNHALMMGKGVINEPTAAAVYCCMDKPGLYLVYDLGGGTFDVSIVSVDNSGIRVLCTDGLSNLAGNDFDRAVLNRIFAQHKIPVRYKSEVAIQEALASIQQAKEDFR